MKEIPFLTDIMHYLIIGVTIIVGFLFAWGISNLIKRRLERKFTEHTSILLSNIIFYFGVFIVLMTVVHEAGLKLSAIFGAAGIAGIAIGLAAQTSISNVISGIFLLVERPFLVGDFVLIQNVGGIVKSIDLLSTTLVTPEKMLVRVPNEVVVKAPIINKTFFKEQRMDLQLQMMLSHDQALKLLPEIQKAFIDSQLILTEPEPLLVITGIDSKAITILFRCWVDTSTRLRMSIYNDLARMIRKLSEQKEIPIAISQIIK